MKKRTPGIAMLWANYIMSGTKQFSQVPFSLKQEVADFLRQEGRADLIKEK